MDTSTRQPVVNASALPIARLTGLLLLACLSGLILGVLMPVDASLTPAPVFGPLLAALFGSLIVLLAGGVELQLLSVFARGTPALIAGRILAISGGRLLVSLAIAVVVFLRLQPVPLPFWCAFGTASLILIFGKSLLLASAAGTPPSPALAQERP